MKRIYLVRATQGEHDDRGEWIVAAYPKGDDADRHCRKAYKATKKIRKKLCRRNRQGRASTHGCQGHGSIKRRYRNKWDPPIEVPSYDEDGDASNFLDWPGHLYDLVQGRLPTYYVEEVPFCADLPED